MTWREATPDEIRDYYREEFPDYVGDLPAHINPAGPTEWALAFDQPYPVKGDRPDRTFVRRSSRQTDRHDRPVGTHFDAIKDVIEFLQAPAYNDPLGDNPTVGLADPVLFETGGPVPEAVYYALDHWDRHWVLAVDIDAKDVALESVPDLIRQRYDTHHDILTHGGVLDSPPDGYPYEYRHIDRALDYAFDVADLFEEHLNADETQVVYSGQGAHVYLLDADRDYHYGVGSREVLVEFLEREFGIPIDPQVTTDQRRVLRLPYSLHAEVSRIVTPIDTPDFDYRTDATPQFIHT